MPDDMMNLPPDAFWYEQQKKKQPGLLARLGAALPDILGAGIAGAATPNIAFGGPTDIFRAMQAGGADREKKDLLAFKRKELQQKDESLINERNARTADIGSKAGIARDNQDIRREQLAQKKIRDAAYIGSLASKAKAAEGTAAHQRAKLDLDAAKAGFAQEYQEAPPPTEADTPPEGQNPAGPRNPMAVAPPAAPPQPGPEDIPTPQVAPRPPMALGPRPLIVPSPIAEQDALEAPPSPQAGPNPDVMITPQGADNQPAPEPPVEPAAIVPPLPPRSMGIFPRPQAPMNQQPRFTMVPGGRADTQAQRAAAQATEAGARTNKLNAQTAQLGTPKPTKAQQNQSLLDEYLQKNSTAQLTNEQKQQILINGRLPAPKAPPSGAAVVTPEAIKKLSALSPEQEMLLRGGRPVSGDRNEEFLNTFPTDAQTYIKGIADYELEPPSEYRRTRDKGDNTTYGIPPAVIMLRVKQYDPNYDEKEYAARSKVVKDFKNMSRTAPGGQIASLNTLTRHIATMQELGEALHNKDTNLINRVSNRLITELGDPRVTNFESAKDAVATELSTALKGQATEADIKAWKDSISANSSSEQLSGQTKTKLALMLSRLRSIQDFYSQSMGGAKQYPILNRDTADTFIRYGLNPGEADSRFTVQKPAGQGNAAPRRRILDPATGKFKDAPAN